MSYNELQAKRKIRKDVREHWWIKVPWMYGLRSQGTVGIYEKNENHFTLLFPATDGENHDIPQAFWEEAWRDEFWQEDKKPRFCLGGYDVQHCTNPYLLALQHQQQQLDNTVFLLLPICYIARQGAEVEGKDGEPDKIQFDVPAGITAFFEEHLKKIKIWLKHGVNYLAIIQRYGGFMGTRDRTNYNAFYHMSTVPERETQITCDPTIELIYDKPGIVEGRTHYLNNNYENYREHADPIIKEYLPVDGKDLFEGFDDIETNPLYNNVSK